MKTVFSDSLTGREFLLEKELSKGKFGRVVLVISKSTHEPFILKETEHLQKEVTTVLQTIHHRSLLTSTEQIMLNGHLYLLRRYETGMSLKEVLKTRNLQKRFSLRFWIEAFIGLLEGLEILHNHQLIHRDIKPANILVTGPNPPKTTPAAPPQIKLIDFEQSQFFNRSIQNTRMPFALCYSPPEQLLNFNNLAGPWSDLFALALSLYEAITQKPAFWYHDPEMLLHLQLNQPIKKGKIPDELYGILCKATRRMAFRFPHGI